jgi:NtrC-family two-component system response regulator AlgB
LAFRLRWADELETALLKRDSARSETVCQPRRVGFVKGRGGSRRRIKPTMGVLSALNDVNVGHGLRAAREAPEPLLETSDPTVQKILDEARRAAGSETPVLLCGQPGTGKNVFARAIHGWSRRGEGPLITLNCRDISSASPERDLFGSLAAKAPKSGAPSPGDVAAADGGTLLLLNLDASPNPLLPQVARLCRDGRFDGTGESPSRAANVRLIATTRREPTALAASSPAIRDLLHALSGANLMLLRLRERSDIVALAEHFLAFYARQMHQDGLRFRNEVCEAFASYAWPGNVRELRNVVERAAILATGPEIGLGELPQGVAQSVGAAGAPAQVGQRVSLDELEREHIRRILSQCGSLEEAAQVLGINPSTLYRKRKRLEL